MPTTKYNMQQYIYCIGLLAPCKVNKLPRVMRKIKSMFTCNADPKGDLIEWTQSKWAKEGEADFSPIRVTEFCAKPFSNDMVCWLEISQLYSGYPRWSSQKQSPLQTPPIYVKVYLARWVSMNLLLTQIFVFQLYSADDPQYSPEELYQKLKTETDPVSLTKLLSVCLYLHIIYLTIWL